MLLKKAILSLPERNRVYLAYRIGFGKESAHSVKQTQEHFGLTEASVRELEKQTMDIIKMELML